MKTINRVTVGKFIKTKRLQAGKTQQELCDKIGISQPKLSKIENGTLVPDVIEYHRLSVYLGLGRIL